MDRMKPGARPKAATSRPNETQQPQRPEPARPGGSAHVPRHLAAARHERAALQPARIHVIPSGQRRAPPIIVAGPTTAPQDAVKALAAYEAARSQGSHPAFDLHGNSPNHKAFIKERDQGGVDLWVFNNSAQRPSGVPCIEHLYWPDTNAFQINLYLGARHDPDCPKAFLNYPPQTEALLGHVARIEHPVEILVGWFRKQMSPRSVAFTPAPDNTPPEPTEEQALRALESFKRQGHHRAYEISASEHKREGWIKRGDAGGVALMAINNSCTRQPGQPRIQVLYWSDEAAFGAQLYGVLKEGKNCPHPQAGQPPAIDAMLAHLQRCQTPLETFLPWCCFHTDPKTVAIKPAATQPVPAAQMPSGQAQPPEAERRRQRRLVEPVRLVDRVNLPFTSVIASSGLRHNIANAIEDWVVLDDGQARARLELDDLRICVDLGPHRDAMFIWLSPDRKRVVDITAHPEAAAWGLAQFPAPGLLCKSFVQAAQPPEARRSHTSQPATLVTAPDVQLLRGIADMDRGMPSERLAWNASEADFELSPSLTTEHQ